MRRLGAEANVLREDVTEAAAGERIVTRAQSAFGAIDVLVNTVGPYPRDVADPVYADDESWRRVFEGVFLTTVRICRAAIPVMKQAGRGAVINVGANSARYYRDSTAQYGAMKSALTHITKNWARDAAPSGVRVNAILPGWIKTSAMAQRLEAANISETAMMQAQAHDNIFWTPRMGRPEEYADVIAFLASDRASYVNGALIPIDGGSPVW